MMPAFNMTLRSKSLIYLSLLLSWLATGCKDNSETPGGKDMAPDRARMLAFYADSVVIPAYDSFAIELSTLSNSTDAFTANPDPARLAALRTAFAAAYLSWQSVELFDFGPAELQTLRSFYNIYPADTAGIAANISNPGAGLDIPAAYPRQGFPALDFLINGTGANDAAICAYYTHATEGSKRLAYLKRLMDRMDQLFKQVLSDWKSGFRNTFVSKTGLDINASSSLLVNGIVLHYERFLRSGKIGIPSGVMLNGIPAPDKVEAAYSPQLSRELAIGAHKAYKAFFNGMSAVSGTQGYGLKAYLDALGAKDPSSGKSLSSLINEQFAAVDAALLTLMPDLSAQIKTDTAPMKLTFDNMQAAVRMLKVDMCSAMSITITFTDNDGD